MKTALLSIALLSALTGSAAAQDGGRLDWKGKGLDPVAPAFADAVRDGRPIMVFFSVEGNNDCISLSRGAFSHPAVLEAAAKVTCLFVECGNKKNSALVSKVGVTQYPTICFFDGMGVPLGTTPARDGPALAAILHDLTERAVSRPSFSENVDEVLQGAKASKLPVLIYFYDDSPASLTINRSLNDPELNPLRPRFRVAKTEMKKGSAICTKYDVDRAPTILVLDTSRQHPEAKPLARIATSRTPRELYRDLEEALGAAGDAGVPAELPKSATQTAGPKEVLSDDEVDRKFIQARLNLALDYQKQGKKEKAIDVLEDVLQSFPRHVLTRDARTLLEKLKQ